MKRPFVLLLTAVFLMIVGVARAQESTPANTRTAVLAGGCFWCIQPAFDKAPGVIKTLVIRRMPRVTAATADNAISGS